jgi:hypothetical protein
MPCSDSLYQASWHQQEMDAEKDKTIRLLEQRCNDLADKLCRLGRKVLAGDVYLVEPDILTWWAEHAKLDAERGEPW